MIILLPDFTESPTVISKLPSVLKCFVASFPASSAYSLISSQAHNELWLHPAALMFWRYRGLLPIIRFQDFFPLCLWCVTPQSAWRVFSCGSGPSDFQTQPKKEHDVSHWGKWMCSGNNDTVAVPITLQLFCRTKKTQNRKWWCEENPDCSRSPFERQTDYSLIGPISDKSLLYLLIFTW